MKRAVLQTAVGCVIGLVVSVTIRTSAVAPSQVPANAPGQPPAGRGRGLAFTEPSPLDFADHEGYVAIFDDKTLVGWDGNPKFWRVENVTAFNGPVNLDWMMTGPQADFWPSRVYTGQFYSENTPMRILAWRGQVVEGFGEKSKRLMGTIGDRQALGEIVKAEDWNQYTVIARGGTFLHIVNGQLMAVMIDDDPASSNNQSGQFGIEIEATTKVSVRNIWVKKIR